MVTGFMDANKKFHPISQSKGTSRKKRLDYNDPELAQNIGVKLQKGTDGVITRMKRLEASEQASADEGVKINRSMHNESIRLKKDVGSKTSVDRNLDILERYYLEKSVSLSDRENAIEMIKKETGRDPRMFGNTDADVLRGIRKIRKESKTKGNDK